MSDEESEPEEEEWEVQQIRKGVTGAQVLKIVFKTFFLLETQGLKGLLIIIL